MNIINSVFVKSEPQSIRLYQRQTDYFNSQPAGFNANEYIRRLIDEDLAKNGDAKIKLEIQQYNLIQKTTKLMQIANAEEFFKKIFKTKNKELIKYSAESCSDLLKTELLLNPDDKAIETAVNYSLQRIDKALTSQIDMLDNIERQSVLKNQLLEIEQLRKNKNSQSLKEQINRGDLW